MAPGGIALMLTVQLAPLRVLGVLTMSKRTSRQRVPTERGGHASLQFLDSRWCLFRREIAIHHPLPVPAGIRRCRQQTHTGSGAKVPQLWLMDR
jgi:hypothetical protein